MKRSHILLTFLISILKPGGVITSVTPISAPSGISLVADEVLQADRLGDLLGDCDPLARTVLR